MRTTDVMRARERVGLAVTACAFVLLGAACGGGASSPGDSEGRPPTGAAARGGTLTAQLTEPTYLAPAQKCYESECSKVLNLVNDKPVSVDLETGDLVFDGLLESIQTTDNKVFTIKIRPNRKFHNGEPRLSAPGTTQPTRRMRRRPRDSSPRSRAMARDRSWLVCGRSTTSPSR
jgi:ABC-type transport system substrate-binding protein